MGTSSNPTNFGKKVVAKYHPTLPCAFCKRGTGNSHIPHRRHEKFGCTLFGCVENATKTEQTKERFYEVRTNFKEGKQISIEVRARGCIAGPVSVQSIGPELIQSLFQTHCFNPSAMTSGIPHPQVSRPMVPLTASGPGAKLKMSININRR
jgi:hypothetical protein